MESDHFEGYRKFSPISASDHEKPFLELGIRGIATVEAVEKNLR